MVVNAAGVAAMAGGFGDNDDTHTDHVEHAWEEKKEAEQLGGEASISGNPWEVLAAVLTVEDIAERLRTHWSTQGVVAALIATMVFAAVLAPPNFENNPNDDSPDTVEHLVELYWICMGLSFTFSAVAILLSTALFTNINQTPDCLLEVWLKRNKAYIMTPDACFIICVFFMAFGMIIVLRMAAPPVAFWFVLVGCGVALMLVVIVVIDLLIGTSKNRDLLLAQAKQKKIEAAAQGNKLIGMADCS
mmetsp:Transcript_27864/g.64272  ORF Transcript_27864/g.64272 Transcript_27864/m.64272 type:complete len:246 (+) Transcript_27864:30-767(+)|eukprot:CAMPEP_0114560300 /NCGR_PEP_ID=MMETSP0114-20121206/11386_1 /TAXON_ID=31324 /ORGANISM="Goniomonas sp, Strain m" /LENGTH=245 /DNA_ID=CAMNT_0001745837 /DNA_START=10 /DNA_END=747 /DNA_ORIENTATION=+